MTYTNPIIQINDVHVQIQSKNLLNGVSVKINQGEFVTIVGPNGAGKSTLLKLMTGIQPVSAGAVEVLGHQVVRTMKRKEIRELRSQVGQVFQGLHLVPRLSVLENVLIGRLSLNKSFKTWARLFTKADHNAAIDAMKLVGVFHKADSRADSLSGGERQKVAIARALAQGTKLILADEPTSNLDPQAATEIAKLLQNLMKEKQITIVSVLHDLSLLTVLNGRVLGLKSGKLVFDHKSTALATRDIDRIYKTEAV